MSTEKTTMGRDKVISFEEIAKEKGFDIDLIRSIAEVVSIPIIASGGMGKSEDVVNVVKEGNADAIAMADILHYERATIYEIRKAAMKENIKVRIYETN